MKNIRCHSFRCARKLADLGKNIEEVGVRSGLMGTFFFGGILFLQMVFFGSKFRSAKLRIRLLSTSLNSPQSQARQASAGFCMFARCLALRRGESEYFNLQRLLIEHSTQANVINACVRCVYGNFQMY